MNVLVSLVISLLPLFVLSASAQLAETFNERFMREQNAVTPARSAWADCTPKQAKAMAPSTASVTEIVDATFAACRRLEHPILVAATDAKIQDILGLFTDMKRIQREELALAIIRLRGAAVAPLKNK